MRKKRFATRISGLLRRRPQILWSRGVAGKGERYAETIERGDVIPVDSRDQSKLESGDLIQVFGQDDKRWSRVAEMADIVAGKTPGRTNPDQITLFKSNGIAIEDIVVAGQIYELCRQRKIGRRLPMWEKDARFGEARGV